MCFSFSFTVSAFCTTTNRRTGPSLEIPSRAHRRRRRRVADVASAAPGRAGAQSRSGRQGIQGVRRPQEQAAHRQCVHDEGAGRTLEPLQTTHLLHPDHRCVTSQLAFPPKLANILSSMLWRSFLGLGEKGQMSIPVEVTFDDVIANASGASHEMTSSSRGSGDAQNSAHADGERRIVRTPELLKPFP